MPSLCNERFNVSQDCQNWRNILRGGSYCWRSSRQVYDYSIYSKLPEDTEAYYELVLILGHFFPLPVWMNTIHFVPSFWLLFWLSATNRVGHYATLISRCRWRRIRYDEHPRGLPWTYRSWILSRENSRIPLLLCGGTSFLMIFQTRKIS